MTTQRPWEAEKAWTDKFLPEVATLCAPVLIQPATLKDDAEQATDLRVLVARDVCIGVRLRRHKYLRHYGNEITIRAGVPSGATTEFAKIMTGWGDYFFYGFTDETQCKLINWALYDLKEVRRTMWKLTQKHGANALRRYLQVNHDGTKFYALPVSLLQTARCAGADAVSLLATRPF